MVSYAVALGGATDWYGYAPSNKRIYHKKSNGTEEWTLWAARGEKLGTFGWTYSWDSNSQSYVGDFHATASNVYFAGKLISDGNQVCSGSNCTRAAFQDRLGTNRASGARFYPYGDEIGGETATSNDREKFVTYTRDSVSGLDYANQRSYASAYGRFTTPDPSAKSVSPRDPGTWNRYSYTAGDPINRNDPKGTCFWINQGGQVSTWENEVAIYFLYMGYLSWNDVQLSDWAPCGSSVTVTDSGSSDGDSCYSAENSGGCGGGGGAGGPTPAEPDPGGGGDGINIVPIIAKEAPGTADQIRALTNGLNAAWDRVGSDPTCATSLVMSHSNVSQVAQKALESTTYYLTEFPNQRIGAETYDLTDVAVNTAGTFFMAGANANGTVGIKIPSILDRGGDTTIAFANIDTMRAFMLLHELGHQLGTLGPDKTSTINGLNSWSVLDNCFTKKGGVFF